MKRPDRGLTASWRPPKRKAGGAGAPRRRSWPTSSGGRPVYMEPSARRGARDVRSARVESTGRWPTEGSSSSSELLRSTCSRAGSSPTEGEPRHPGPAPEGQHRREPLTLAKQQAVSQQGSTTPCRRDAARARWTPRRRQSTRRPRPRLHAHPSPLDGLVGRPRSAGNLSPREARCSTVSRPTDPLPPASAKYPARPRVPTPGRSSPSAIELPLRRHGPPPQGPRRGHRRAVDATTGTRRAVHPNPDRLVRPASTAARASCSRAGRPLSSSRSGR
jgi:hypothetical protein